MNEQMIEWMKTAAVNLLIMTYGKNCRQSIASTMNIHVFNGHVMNIYICYGRV